MIIDDQQLIDLAIDRYRRKHPRLHFPQPSRHKSKIVEGFVILRNKTKVLATYRISVAFRAK